MLKSRMTATVAAFVLALAGHAHAQEEETRSETRSIQAMLTECGFAPGPVDGLWGAKTAQAAVAYIRAHGDEPVSASDERLLKVQVSEHWTDNQPCPADHEATGPVEQEEDAQEQAQTKEPEITGEAGKLIKEIESKLNAGPWTGSGHMGLVQTTQSITIQGETITVNAGGDWVRTAKLTELKGGRGITRPGGVVVLKCRNGRPCVESGTESDVLLKIYPLSRAETKSARRAELHLQLEVGGEIEELADKLSTIYENKQPAPDKPQCYEWADLGSVSTGAWRNAYGHVAGGLRSGDLGKAWDRAELNKNYVASHLHCLPNGESAMRQAHSDMVVVGRHVTDVQDERRRIREYFQGKVKECQAEFTRRYEHFEPQMCD